MDSEYDKKFEEMKKYIPFLESMITRLESHSPASTNPRQAQLDKIRSLRDLLLNKKKRLLVFAFFLFFIIAVIFKAFTLQQFFIHLSLFNKTKVQLT